MLQGFRSIAEYARASVTRVQSSWQYLENSRIVVAWIHLRAITAGSHKFRENNTAHSVACFIAYINIVALRSDSFTTEKLLASLPTMYRCYRA